MSAKLPLYLKFYGISPWETEVLYSTLHKLFNVQEDPNAAQEDDFTTLLDITFPWSFNDEFFKQFGIQRWEKIKGIIKEMKRRRGGGKSLCVYIGFSGKPNIIFTIDLDDRHSFDTAVDKIDFVLELLPYHLDPKKMPIDIIKISYQFDDMTGRWKIISNSEDQTYHFTENEWKII
ncbi:conserved hypothetical protein [Nitrosotalea sinensis]|jgi:hypothetical protein|uniref:Uncharacterized protein n=1 Tax=Nitrosotalea sinensis TaxID=1499975 RepID=A0A2H1EEM5_9ARCH|nr:hypothetical protein [Candidatus Nitrosotalea sinensis]SHO42464.1 conserved hypothetical protein [Candidatus Nitrosotalea sinensis]